MNNSKGVGWLMKYIQNLFLVIMYYIFGNILFSNEEYYIFGDIVLIFSNEEI